MTTVVVGVGNVLTGDDALGPTVVHRLDAEWETPPEVEVVDGGTPGTDLALLAADRASLIVVDTVSADAPPGTLRLYDRKRLLARALTPRVNPHAPGLMETLHSLKLHGRAPGRVLLVGVVPGPVEIGVGMSPEVEAAVEPAMGAVVEELVRLGHLPVRRSEPRDPDLWWTRAARGTTVRTSPRS